MNNNEIKPVAVFISPLATRSGYGDKSVDVVRSLMRYNKFDLKLISTKWGICPMNQLSSPKDDDIISKLLTTNLNAPPYVHMQCSIPPEFSPQGRYNIGVTAGIETTMASVAFIDGINKMNLIIVPSNHAKQVFETTTYVKQESNGNKTEGKCNVPIEVVFEGADTNIYKKTSNIPKSICDELNGISEDFLFLFVGHWMSGEIGHDRKDVGMLVKVFLEMFKGKKKKPGLLLKTGTTFSAIEKADLFKKINIIKSSVGDTSDLPNVYLLHGDLTKEEVNGLYNHPKVKAHVSFTKGECAGRPILEASLSGKPVIVSNWSGHLDYLDKDLAILLPGEVRQVHPSSVNEWIIKESGWFFVNYSIAAQKMEDVFNNYQKYLPNAEKLRIQNEQKFSLSAMDKVLFNVLDKYVPKAEKQMQFNLPTLKRFGISTTNSINNIPSFPIADIELPKLKKV